MSDSRAKIRAELRWLSSLVGLIDRPDQNAVLLEKASQLDRRLDRVQAAYEKLLALNLDGSDESDLSLVESDVDQCQEMANRVMLRASVLRGIRAKLEVTNSEPAIRVRPELAARLPAVQLPRFTGVIDEWTSFIDLFDSLVHLRDDLTPALKLAQLFAALHGEPRSLVAHLSVSDENYETARTLLASRYHNVRRLADSLLAKIWGIPKVSRVCEVRVTVLNPVITATKALAKLGLPVD